ncbi:TPA: hypothetical protein DCZ15_00830 [Candidatus Falkowbacteria bacterium]|nr:MAG: hypothetical protein UV95_C0003G0027 [Candidatus Falkowbacteria bacterium GW2011_GWF2_43_32]HBA36399.1 hypothetical protein [Candidatus Falkowbacteria bacterium]
MKKVIFLSLAVLLAVFAIVNNSQSKIKTYYSGDAISFNNEVYVGSTNTDSLEILKLEDGQLKLIAKIKPFDAKLNRYDKFYDLKFSVEDNHLFVFAVSGFTLYKYEIANDVLNPITSQRNTYWEWYTRVDKFGHNLATISDKGVKIWNKDLQVIDAHKFTNADNPHNIKADGDRFILNVQDGYLTVYDRETRLEKTKIALNYKETGNRQAYQDGNSQLYVVDDYYAKKFDLDGRLLGSFQHLDYNGYDMSGSGYTDYVYFSNGLGVVKLDKNTMQAVSSANTVEMGGPSGWAMGLKVVYADGEKIVVFNNSNILVMDGNLKKLASYQATEETDTASLENLYLNLDHTFGAPGATVVLNGGGYFPNEDLHILFDGTENMIIKSDNRGRFYQPLVVPSLSADRVDIKVDGEISGLTYSISFTVTE